MDSLWSTRPSYQPVQNVVARYSAHRGLNGHDASQDGPRELLRVFMEVGSGDRFADVVENHNRAYSYPKAMLKARRLSISPPWPLTKWASGL
jgi:hypothetical protein